MKQVLSVVTFGIGALLFAAFFTALKPTTIDDSFLRRRLSRRSATARFSDLLRRSGNGWPGSTASGVSAGNTDDWKCDFAAAF